MPATRFRCCGNEHTLDELLAHTEQQTNRCEWTWELLSAMLHAQTQHPSNQDGTRISTTVLTNKCLRRIVFERQSDYTIDPADLYALFRGTQFHGVLEGWAHPDSYAEARFNIPDLGRQIPAVAEGLPDEDRSFSGSPDLVRPQSGILYDYKRTKEVPRFQHVWPDHVAQLNINRWLVDKADTVTDAAGVTHSLEDLAVRARFVPDEWTHLVVVYVDDKGPKPLEITKSIQIPKKSGKGTKAARVADIWDDEKVETYIGERYIAARRAFLDGIAPIPFGWERQSHALCVRCPMRRLCADNERQGR